MKRTIAAASLALAMSLGFTSHASAQAGQVVAQIPFDFAVGGHVLPQGSYHIVGAGNLLAFRNAEQKTSIFNRGLNGETSTDGKTVLVFDDVNGNYFLRKIVTVSDGMSMEFPVSNLESKIRKPESTRSVYGDISGR
jgi:hypothetical protein